MDETIVVTVIDVQADCYEVTTFEWADGECREVCKEFMEHRNGRAEAALAS